MQADIIPLAITMMAGPQILADIIFVTSKKGAVKVSLSYLAGILLAATTCITLVFVVSRLLGLSAGATGKPPHWESLLEIGLVILLILLSLRSYMTRKTAKPPKWLGELQDTRPAGAFKLGVLLICLMPGDIIVMLTVGLHLAAHGSVPSDILSVLPFMGLLMLIAALPLLSFLLFRKHAEQAMPKIRNWMQSHSWLINIIVYLFFIVLITT